MRSIIKYYGVYTIDSKTLSEVFNIQHFELVNIIEDGVETSEYVKDENGIYRVTKDAFIALLIAVDKVNGSNRMDMILASAQILTAFGYAYASGNEKVEIPIKEPERDIQ